MTQRTRTLFPTEPGEFVFRDADGNEVMRTPAGQVAPPAGAPTEEPPGVTKSALMRGLRGVQSDLSGFAGTVSEGMGNDILADSFFQSADQYMKSAEEYAPRIGRVENIQSVGDAGIYAWEVLLENAPMLATMLIPGASVAKATQLVTKSAKAGQVAGTSAAFLADVGLQTGESASIAREAGGMPADVRVYGAGLGKAMLDFVPIVGIARRLGIGKNLPFVSRLERLMFGELAERGFIRRAARGGAGIAAVEVPTETMQEVINITLERFFTEFEGDLTEDEKSQLLNAAAGAGVFGLLGIPAAVRSSNSEQRQTDERQPEGTDIQIEEANQILNVDIDGTTPGDFSSTTSQDVLPPEAVEPTAQFGDLLPTVSIENLELPPLDPQAAEVESLQASIDAAVNEPYDQDLSFIVDMDGQMNQLMPSDPMLRTEPAPTTIATGLNATKEMLQVASSYPQYAELDPRTPEAQNLAGLHPGLQTLIELRADVAANEDNYRTTDGQLKKAAERRLENIDKRIEKLQSRLGIDPASYVVVPATSENMQQPQPVEDVAPDELTPKQMARLEALSIKAEEGSLSEVENDQFTELMAIASGELKQAATRPQTKEELQELKDLTNEVRANESTREFKAAQKKKAGTGLKAEEAQKILEKFTRNLQYGPKVRLLNREHPETILKMHKNKSEMRGWWDPKKPGEVVLIPSNLHDEKAVIETYLHETLTHYGLGTMYTRDEHIDLLKSMLEAAPPGLDVEGMRRDIAQGKTLNLFTEAEEYIATVAERAVVDPKYPVVQMSWWKRMIAGLRAKLRKWYPKLTWTDNDIMFLLRDNMKMISGQITPRNLAEDGRPMFHTNEMLAMFDEGQADVVNRNVADMKSVWGARFAKWFYTPMQFAEQYNVPGAQQFLEHVQQWWARKRILTDTPTRIASEIMKLGKRDQTKLAQAVMQISIESDEQGRRLTHEETQKIFKDLGMENDTQLQQHWADMDKTFTDTVQQLRKGLGIIAIRTADTKAGIAHMDRKSAEAAWNKYEGLRNSKERKEWMNTHLKAWLRIQDIEAEMAQLLDRNYFPRMRFGQWSITIRAKKDLTYEGKPYKGPGKGRGDVLYFETFESQRAQQQAFKDLQKAHPESSFQMQMGKLSDSEFHFMGAMSPQLYEQLVQAIPTPANDTELGMSTQMKEVLKEIYLKQAPGRSFLRHLTKRKGIEGYSQDVLRVYSSYMMNVANHIARVEYHLDMNEQLSVLRDSAATVVPDARVSQIVSEYFQGQYDYLMNPKDDLARARAVGFLWYLGANVKSAAVNLTQVPMVAYPYLASRYGDGQSVGAIMSAMKMVAASKMGRPLSDELQSQIDRAVKEGFVDESRATELAGLAESDVLQRLIPETKTGRAIAKTSYYGAYLFQKAERYNREVTFIAGYNLAKQSGASQEQAFRAGRKAVQTAMFEYAKWNRPAFMRGRKSVFFLFWQYMQGLSYMAFGGAGQGSAMRVWMTLLLAGGLQGLPFAENIFDLLDFLGTKSKETLGLKDPRVDLRSDLRELVGELTDTPDLVMHGLSRYYGLGPAHILNAFDIPVPNVDISGSISAGRVLPGTDDFLGHERDPSAQLGRAIVDIAGPVAGIPYQVWRSANDSNPDSWKVWERTLPVAFKNLSAAARRGVRGEESYRGGGAVTEFSPHETEHRAELLANAFGFAPTRLNQRYEQDFAANRLKQYWVLRRALVMENVGYAYMSGDPEAIADANRALERFNSIIPDPALAIRGRQLQQSLRQRFRRGALRERGIPSERLYRRLVESMRELYPESSAETVSSSQQ